MHYSCNFASQPLLRFNLSRKAPSIRILQFWSRCLPSYQFYGLNFRFELCYLFSHCYGVTSCTSSLNGNVRVGALSLIAFFVIPPVNYHVCKTFVVTPLFCHTTRDNGRTISTPYKRNWYSCRHASLHARFYSLSSHKLRNIIQSFHSRLYRKFLFLNFYGKMSSPVTVICISSNDLSVMSSWWLLGQSINFTKSPSTYKHRATAVRECQ